MLKLIIASVLTFKSIFVFANDRNVFAPAQTLMQNTPQCAADQNKPAESIFVALNLSSYTTFQINLAKRLSEEINPFVQTGNQVFKQRITLLARAITEGLRDGTLPMVQNESSIQQGRTAEVLEKNFSRDQKNSALYKCHQVTEINSYYSNLFVRGIQASTLENLAKKVINPNYDLHDCSPESIKKNFDVFPVYNMSLAPPAVLDWQKSGFTFWESFKTYLSWAWKNVETGLENEKTYLQLMQAIPIEEQAVLMPNGCKSISRPECTSNGMTGSILRTLVEPSLTKEKIDELPSTSIGIQDFIRDNNDVLNFRIQSKLYQQADRNEWVQTFQRNYQKFSVALTDQFFAAHRMYSGVRTQIGMDRLVNDVTQAFKSKENLTDLYYLCSEALTIYDRESMSFYKVDHQLVREEGSRLNRFLLGGARIEDMMNDFSKVASAIAQKCKSVSAEFYKAGLSTEKNQNFRPWYISYLKRYGPLYSTRAQERAFELVSRRGQNQEVPTGTPKVKLNYYTRGLCSDPVECTRDLIEGFIIVNRVLLFQEHVFKTKIPDVSLFAEKQEKVSCGFYDPFEVSRLNKAKLKADLGSAILFGWANIPVYLDVNFAPKELISFNKLIKDGQVRFDYEFDPNQRKISAGVNFGSLMNVPCRVEISQTKPISTGNNQYIFNGAYVSACKNNTAVNGETIGGDPSTGRLSHSGAPSMCGQCVFSFTQVATLVPATGFSLLRFGARLIEAITRYNEIKDNDVINPRQFPVNHKHLVDVYQKNNGVIPDDCVEPLSRGWSCLGNLCESRTASEFENQSGLKVESVSLVQNMDLQTPGEYEAWIKAKGCSHDIRMTVRCDAKARRFWMSYSPWLIRSCQKEKTL